MTAAVTLVRLTPAGGAADTLACYVAVPSSCTLEVLVEIPGLAEMLADVPMDADTVPWETFPGLQRRLARLLDGVPRSFVFLGTVSAGRWVSWYAPGRPPGVPRR